MAIKKGAERLQKEMQEFVDKKAKHLENAEAFKSQGDEINVSIKKARVVRSGQVDRLLEDSPGLKSKGLIDRLLKSKLGESRQLEDNFEKLELGYANEKRKAAECELQIRKLSTQLEDLKFNERAEAWAKGLDSFISAVEKTEAVLQDLKQKAAEASEDPSWNNRLPKLGFDENYMFAAANYFTPGSLNAMTSHSLIQSLQRLSGKPLLKTVVHVGTESSLSLERGATGRAFRNHY